MIVPTDLFLRLRLRFISTPSRSIHDGKRPPATENPAWKSVVRSRYRWPPVQLVIHCTKYIAKRICGFGLSDFILLSLSFAIALTASAPHRSSSLIFCTRSRLGFPSSNRILVRARNSSFRSAVSSFSASPSNAAAKALSLGIEAGFRSRSGNWTMVCSPTSIILRRTGSIQSWRIRWPEYA